MKDWTIRSRILASFGVILALMVVMSALAYTRLIHISDETEDLSTNSLVGLEYTTDMRIEGVGNYSLLEAHILQKDPAKMAKLEETMQATHSRIDTQLETYLTTSVTDKDKELANKFKAARANYIKVREEVLKESRVEATKPEAIRRNETELKPLFDEMQKASGLLVANDQAEAKESITAIAQSVHLAQMGIGISLGIALLLAAICGYFLFQSITGPMGRLLEILDVMRTGDFSRRLELARNDEFGVLAGGFNRMTDEITMLVGQVQQTGIQINTSVMEIAATAREQQATASEIAATTTEIGATSKEISATSRELVKTMDEVSTVAEQSAILAGSGQVGLTHMEETMRHVMEAAGSINAKLAVLSEKAGNIGQVVTTITKVADQTNMLSLNAAIEAEKAGEYGRGFAVVATEIRRLADQTAVATYDIEQMVREIQSAVSAGVMGMDKFSEEVRRGMQEVQQVGGQLSQIIQQVQALAPRIELVNEGMQAQTTGAAEITQALGQLSEAAQQTVESLHQSGAAIDELNKVSSGLGSAVSRFKLRK
ncbi:MAG: methyl-accepting chemotaxis sensory transducer [Chthoniobacteraceae bacterium]|nr:methyl-accepting chemotaxis sensory transducer [Chthoniobacteraceae bacterium]